MHKVELCVVKDGARLARPFMTFAVAEHKAVEFIEDVSKLGKWAPVAIVLDGSVLTEIVYERDTTTFRGQSVVWLNTEH